jgi:hypothetical protein
VLSIEQSWFMPIPTEAATALSSAPEAECPLADWPSNRINRVIKRISKELGFENGATSYTFRYNYMGQIMDLPSEERQRYSLHMDPDMINSYLRFGDLRTSS